MKFADIAVSAFLILFPLAWLASSAYATWKEYHRHIEQIEMLNNMRRADGELYTILAKCLIAWVNQKSLIAYRDEDGTLLEATLSDYLLLMLEAKTTRLTTTHIVPGVFKMKVAFELLESESPDRG